MKKTISFILLTIISIFALSTFTACGKSDDDELNIMNWEEYIDENIVNDFIEYYADTHNGKRITVNYSTQGTNENMYTQLTLKRNHYDLVCPSEYMIQKMMVEGMLEELDRENYNVNDYDNGVSPYIANLFKNTTMETPDGVKSLHDYACCYMWGTMGYVYNSKVNAEDMKSWSAVWNDAYRNKATIKNSVRDSYVLAIGHAKKAQFEELAKNRKDALTGDPENDSKVDREYNKALTAIFNDVSENSLKQAEDVLKELAPKLYGYEVDSGKKDMAAGKIWINFAWSGDAVFAMDYAEDPEMVGDNVNNLYYVVPNEGSNIFFDGWVMPKGANVELAQEFINFIQRPENAIKNMDYIGYTTAIATDEIFERLTLPKEGEVPPEDEIRYDYGYAKEDIQSKLQYDGEGNPYIIENGEEVKLYAHDLNYLFGGEKNGKYVVYNNIENKDRQFDTQYPDYETVARCTVMCHFGYEETNNLTQMWLNVTSGNDEELPALYITILVVLIVIIIAIVLFILNNHGVFNHRHIKKGYSAVAVNGIPIDEYEEDDDDEDDKNKDKKKDKIKDEKKKTQKKDSDKIK